MYELEGLVDFGDLEGKIGDNLSRLSRYKKIEYNLKRARENLFCEFDYKAKKPFEQSVIVELNQLVIEVGKIIKRIKKSGQINKYTKNAEAKQGDDANQQTERGTVTNADILAHQTLTNRLKYLFPGTEIISEEGTIQAQFLSGYNLVIDPIDGTWLYLEGGYGYSINAGLYNSEGELVNGIVHLPETGTTLNFDGKDGVQFRAKKLLLSRSKHKGKSGYCNRRVDPKLKENENLECERNLENRANEAWIRLYKGEVNKIMVAGKNEWDVIALRIIAKDPRFEIKTYSQGELEVIMVSRIQN